MRSLKDIRGLPIYLSVYRSTFPSFQLYSKEDAAELVVMAPPPSKLWTVVPGVPPWLLAEHFVAMCRLLGFHGEMRALLESFNIDQESATQD